MDTREMTREEVYCEDCDNALRQGPSYAWMCILAPRTGTGFCTRDLWDDDPPYYRCNTVNTHGNCAWWAPIPEGSDSTEAERTARGKKRGE